MWKKEEEQPVRPTVAATASTEPVRAPAPRSEPASIGPSIVIRGEVSGSEDLLIQGQIDGSVALEKHAVTVGGGGRVKANITGRVITVEGEVEGDLSAEEQIVLRGSSKVLGDIKAPRVVLEDGASFRGLVDMGSPRGEKAGAGAASGSSKEGGSSKSEAAKGTGGAASAHTKGGQAPATASSSSGSPSGGGQSSAPRSGAGGGRDASERRTGS